MPKGLNQGSMINQIRELFCPKWNFSTQSKGLVNPRAGVPNQHDRRADQLASHAAVSPRCDPLHGDEERGW